MAVTLGLVARVARAAEGEPPSPAPSPGPPPGEAQLPHGDELPVPWPVARDRGTPASDDKTGALGPPRSTDRTRASDAPERTPPAPFKAETKLGLYGEAAAFWAPRDDDLDGNVRRVVAWLTHRPTSWLRLKASVEYDHAGARGHDFAPEQLLVEATPHPAIGVRAGLLLLPLGMVNQAHDPTTILTVDRPLTEQLIIPTSWRELGVGVFGQFAAVARYELDVVGGLDGAGFSGAAPLWNARGNGTRIALHQPALTGRLEIGDTGDGVALGGGGYYGGASGGEAKLSGVSAGVAELDLRWSGAGAEVRAELAEIFIVNSYRVNDYLGLLGDDAVPKVGRGVYALGSYDFLRALGRRTLQALVGFVEYENVNPRSNMSGYNYNPPSITTADETSPNARTPSPSRSFVRAGLVYRPRPVVAVKADVQVALDDPMVVAASPVMVLPSAPARPIPLPADVVASARGRTRVGVAAAFSF